METTQPIRSRKKWPYDRNNRAETFDLYQMKAGKTSVFPCDNQLDYLTIGLCEEAGEVAGKVKRIIRDNDGKADAASTKQIILELGDVLWYLSQIATILDVDLSDVASLNLEKIYSRMQRNKLHGEGDNR